jgi:YegS/Rv2252/BmrU family lipid kinase
MRVVIIINPISGPPRRGRGSERVELAKRTLDRLGVRGEVRVTERGGHAHELALDAAASGAQLVVAWGGDGTINEIGRALVQIDESGDPTPDLGIVPGGSGNGLARGMSVPFDPALAIEHAIRSPARSIDAGELGEHLFFNVAGIGLDAHVAALVSTRVRHRGLLAYVKASLSDLIRPTTTEYTIDIDGKTSRVAAMVVAFANSKQYGFGAQIAPAAQFDDGLLDMIAIEDRTFLGNMVRAPSLFVGRLDRRAGVHATQFREVTVRSSSAMLFHVDGEAVQGGDTLTARVHPRALRLRTPI